MKLMEGEKKILNSSGRLFELTTHRVRFNSISHGSGSVVSIMLEHVTSCEIMKKVNRLYLILAALAAILGVIIAMVAILDRDEDIAATAFIIGGIVAIVFVGLYFTKKQQVFVLSSPSARIYLDLKNIPLYDLLKVIDEIETAQHLRALAINNQ